MLVVAIGNDHEITFLVILRHPYDQVFSCGLDRMFSGHFTAAGQPKKIMNSDIFHLAPAGTVATVLPLLSTPAFSAEQLKVITIRVNTTAYLFMTELSGKCLCTIAFLQRHKSVRFDRRRCLPPPDVDYLHLLFPRLGRCLPIISLIDRSFTTLPETFVSPEPLAGHGQPPSVPDRYPEDAWFHYHDRTCGYGCQAAEYAYWALTSILGAQDHPRRRREIADEWELHSRELVRTRDPNIYRLLTDPRYRFPTVLPDGTYRSGQKDDQTKSRE